MNRRRKISVPKLILIFVIVVIAILGILMLFRQNGNPFIRHTVTYDNSVSQEEKAVLEQYFETNSPAADLTISADYTQAADKDNTAIYSVLLPVTGFYNPESNLTSGEVLAVLEELNSATRPILISSTNEVSPQDTKTYLLPQNKLDGSVKLLSIDDHYYLDDVSTGKTATTGAVYRIFNISSGDQAAAAKTAEQLTSTFIGDLGGSQILKFIQTGVTALTRQMQNRLNATGDASLFAAKIADFLSSADYTHTSNEVSFAEDCNNNTPMAFCSDYRMYQVLEDSGIDIVELTGNHNNDWGASANLATIDFYHDHGIKTVGGGKTEEEAKNPLQLSDKNTSIALIAINNSTSTKANGQGASGDHPGANIYDEETTLAQIKGAKARGDFVILDVQFFECYSYPDDGEEMPSCDLPISGQEEFFKKLADAGADMIVGTQAHQPQTFELYNNKPIYYGLGNLFFDQYQWPGTMRSLVLSHYFKDGKLLQTKVTPTMYDRNFQTAIMDEISAYNYLKRLTSYMY